MEVKTVCNLGENICTLFYVLEQFLFATSETKPDYCHQKVNIRITSRVAEEALHFRLWAGLSAHARNKT